MAGRNKAVVADAVLAAGMDTTHNIRTITNSFQ
jgi:hypothetical protein